jgi:chromate transporter
MEQPPPLPPTSTPVAFTEALRFWLKLGCVSFGGPAGQIALMHEELVVRRRWISEERFLHALNFCMLLPGPEAQQLATYMGWIMHKTWGGLAAGALFILPSLVLMIVLAGSYVQFGDVPWVAAMFYGVKPAVTAIVAHAAFRLGSRTLKTQGLFSIAAASFIAITVFHLPFPAIVALAALAGFIGGHRWPTQFRSNQRHITDSTHIEDHPHELDHTRFKRGQFAGIILAGAAAWLGPMGYLLATFGWQHTLTQMSWFFTKAALLTFGGAYAVLPYVYQGAVEHYGWLTSGQMMDGLALGESTPGPLIMVVAFVGYLGGYLKAALGTTPLWLPGMAAACLVTWFTFLPSFVFIFAGGPLIESTHKHPRFTAPLTGIAAAVVGVILNLAVFFAYHVFWPQGFQGAIDVSAILIALGAAGMLFRLKLNVLWVLSLGMLAGLLLKTM